MRRIGSDLEHLIRGMLQRGEISYNLNSRVLNYSMGRPRLDTTAVN
ncbi:MAG: NAD(P)H-quinone oxidoreductase subunit M [Gloeomargarita sp. DG02_3_bins_56]